MTDEEKKKYRKFMDENYPYIQPCVYCHYYRRINTSRPFNKNSPLKADGYDNPCCYYGIENDEPRGETTIYKNGKCSKFLERRKENERRKTKFNAY